MSSTRTMYARNPRPAVMREAMTKKTRTSVGSTCRYSAMPPHTPATTLFVALRSRRVGMDTFPSFAKFVRDRDAERGKEAEWDRGVGRDLGDRDEAGGDRDQASDHDRDPLTA